MTTNTYSPESMRTYSNNSAIFRATTSTATNNVAEKDEIQENAPYFPELD